MRPSCPEAVTLPPPQRAGDALWYKEQVEGGVTMHGGWYGMWHKLHTHTWATAISKLQVRMHVKKNASALAAPELAQHRSLAGGSV